MMKALCFALLLLPFLLQPKQKLPAAKKSRGNSNRRGNTTNNCGSSDMSSIITRCCGTNGQTAKHLLRVDFREHSKNAGRQFVVRSSFRQLLLLCLSCLSLADGRRCTLCRYNNSQLEKFATRKMFCLHKHAAAGVFRSVLLEKFFNLLCQEDASGGVLLGHMLSK